MGKVTLRRYTDLAATVHILRKRVITLLDPDSWDDRNAAYFMSQYKSQKKAQSVLALCFAEASETYHHWKVFSPGSNGVCIEFEKEKLRSAFAGDQRVRLESVKYETIKNIGSLNPELEDLPFLKRYPYQDEREFRIVCVDDDSSLKFKDYEIPLGCIERVNLSPWMPKALRDSVAEILRSIDGCEQLRVNRSTLIENEQWKNVADLCREIPARD